MDQGSPGIALALGGGAARGLAHVGVLEVFERERIQVRCVAGSSMGGVIGALLAKGLDARAIRQIAETFYFPKWFIPGALVSWEAIFGEAAEVLRFTDFASLERPLLLTATDLETGTPAVLSEGQVLPAVRATCAVPGVLPPEHLNGRWLVDGGLVDLVPVDLAQTMANDVVVAVRIRGARSRPMPQLEWPVSSLLSRLGSALPNPATAKMSFEILVRSAEIALDRATELIAAMAGPEIFIEPDTGDIGLRDFDRLDEAVAAGRRAAETALPEIERELERAASAGRS